MAETKLKEEWEKITLFQGVINGYNTSSSKVTFLSIMKRKKIYAFTKAEASVEAEK